MERKKTYPAAGRRPVLSRVAALTTATGARAAAPKTTTVLLYGELGWDVDAAEIVSAIESTAGSIHLRVNSPGGSFHDGLAVYGAMRSHRGTVSVTVDGLAASAATLVMMGASPGQLAAAEHAVIMAHDVWTTTTGPEADHLESAGVLGRASDKLASIYASRTGIPAASWRAVMRRETWYEAHEALAAGLIDRIARQDDDREVPAWMTS